MSRITPLLAACFRFTLASIFWVAVRVSHTVELHGLEHDAGKHPAYYAMAHKRDIDPLVEVPSVLAHRGWRALASDVRFALRGDAFAPGFLARIVRHPRWLARLLRILSLGTVLRSLGMQSITNVHLHSGEVLLHEWLRSGHDGPAGDNLTPAFLQQLASQSGETAQTLATRPVSSLMAWRYQSVLQPLYSVDIFLEPARGRMKKVLLNKVKRELAAISAWLTQGGSIWGAPEGQLSPTGALSPIASALPILMQASRADTCIVPVSITYDFMTVGRARIFVHISPPLEREPLLSAAELKIQLREKWLLGAYFTCTQLASNFLVQASHAKTPAFTLDQLARKLTQDAAWLAENGRHVDRRLLSARHTKMLAARFLTYAQRRSLVRRSEAGAWIASIGDLELHVSPGDVGYRDNPLAYAWNEWQDLLSISLLADLPAPITTLH